MRIKALPLLMTVVLAGAAAPATSAHMSKPVIKGEEVGYFGSATTTYSVEMFVYTNMAPRPGAHVTVCYAGKCERATGHRNPAPWYSATFTTHGLQMGNPVRFTVRESDAAGQAKATVTQGLLCMHNNGSTPQH